MRAAREAGSAPALLLPSPGDGSASDDRDHADLEEVHREYRRTHDPRLRERLVLEHRGLARHYAKRFARASEPLEDLEQVAVLAMLKALDRFDPDRGVRFATYAGRVISGELKRHFRDRTWAIRVPRPLQELYLGARNASALLQSELGRAPLVVEVAEHLGVTEEAVLEAMEAGHAYHPASLDAPVSGESSEQLPQVGCDDPGLARAYDRMWQDQVLEALQARLSADERRLLRLYYVNGLSQVEIGERLGMSQVAVSRRLQRIIGKLRALSYLL